MIKNSSIIVLQNFRKVVFSQYTKRNFCCSLSSYFTLQDNNQCNNKLLINHQNSLNTLWRRNPYYDFSTASDKSPSSDRKNKKNLEKKASDDLIIDITQQKNVGLFAKFKLMYKQYWYVLIPVHITTSLGFIGGFYYLSKSGIDIVGILQSLHVSEVLVSKFQDSNLGHYAIAYLCYKLITPIRYAITIGGTTIAIKSLVKGGYIKPVPTKQEFIKMYEAKKANLTKFKRNN